MTHVKRANIVPPSRQQALPVQAESIHRRELLRVIHARQEVNVPLLVQHQWCVLMGNTVLAVCFIIYNIVQWSLTYPDFALTEIFTYI